jgi:hypothetical protein
VISGAAGADVVLRGRLLALEEISEQEAWRGRLVVELELWEAARGGRVVWSGLLSEEQVLDRRHPEALAQAASSMLSRGVDALAPQLQEVSSQLRLGQE